MKLTIFGLGLVACSLAVAAHAEGALPFKKVTDDAPVRKFLVEHSELKDPFSVQFRNLYSREIRSDKKGVRSEYIYCGELNAKNSYGGYSGWSRFFAGRVGESPSVDIGDSDSSVYIKFLCKDAPQ